MKKSNARKEFQVPSDLLEVQKTSASVLSFLKPLGLNDGAAFDIRLCLEEALINAMKYGNGLRREVPVHLSVEFDGDEVRIEVKDQGRGFDVKKLQDCTQAENLSENHGRGVFLIRQLMDIVKYNSKGNAVTMIKSTGGR